MCHTAFSICRAKLLCTSGGVGTPRRLVSIRGRNCPKNQVDIMTIQCQLVLWDWLDSRKLLSCLSCAIFSNWPANSRLPAPAKHVCELSSALIITNRARLPKYHVWSLSSQSNQAAELILPSPKPHPIFGAAFPTADPEHTPTI